MPVSDDLRSKVKEYVTGQLAAAASGDRWPMDALAETVDVDRDDYQAVLELRCDRSGTTRLRELTRTRHDLSVVPLGLQKVRHEVSLSREELDLLKRNLDPVKPEIQSPRGLLSRLAAFARSTQIADLLSAVLVAQGAGPARPLDRDTLHAGLAEVDGARGVLVSFTTPLPDVRKAIAELEDLLAFASPGNVWRLNNQVRVTAVLVGGAIPLVVRHLAHDLEVAVIDDDENAGLVVSVEERRALQVQAGTKIVVFGRPARSGDAGRPRSVLPPGERYDFSFVEP